VKIKGEWAYLSRAVDKEGLTIAFLLRPERAQDAAERFLRKAIRSQGLPEQITLDQSGSNTAAITRYNKTHKTSVILQHSKSLKKVVAPDPRAMKRLTRPMLGFQSFGAARWTIAGIEVRQAIGKGQLGTTENARQTSAEQCYALAA
jgi:putative transposase